MKRPEYIIQRENLVSRAIELLQSGERIIYIDAKAYPGSGKSILLEQIKKRLDSQKEYQTIPIVVSDAISDIFLKSAKIESPVEHLQKELEGYILILHSFIQKTILDSPINFDLKSAMDMIHTIKDATSGNVTIGDVTIDIDHSEIKKSDVVGNQVTIDYKTSIQAQLNAFRFHLTQILIEQINRKISAKKKVVFLVDDFCYVISHEIGAWLAELLKGLDNVIAIVARSPTYEELKEHFGEVKTLHLEPFDKPDVKKYLTRNMTLRQFENIPDLDKLTEAIYEFSHGHPGTVSLSADSIDKSEIKNIDEVIDFFERLSRVSKEIEESASQQQHEEAQKKVLDHNYDMLIMEILDDIDREEHDLEFALHVGCILNHYDHDRLKEIISKLEGWKAPKSITQDEYFDNLLKLLNEFTFVNGDDGGRQEWHFQNYVRQCLQRIFKDKETKRHGEIQKLACTYYKNLIDAKKQKEMEDLYRGNYILESTVWQTWTKEWLYHLSETQDREQARLQFAKAFFDAFNWWGWFLHFSYCDDLLDIWRICRQDEDDNELGKLLSDFQETYPLGSEDQAEGDLEMVREVLNCTCDLLKLDEDCEGLEQLVILGFIDWYRAESYWLCKEDDQDFEKAEKYYIKSRKLFVRAMQLEPAQSWNVIWSDSYIADLYSTWEKYDCAFNKAKESYITATTQDYKRFLNQDHEVISQNDRILGDAYLGLENIEGAAQAYSCAVYRALTFNFIPKSTPDEYTTKLYENTCDLVTEALVDLCGTDKNAAVQCCQYLHQNIQKPFLGKHASEDIDFSKLLEDEESAELVSKLFPNLPSNDSGSEFEKQVQRYKSMVSEDLREDFVSLEDQLYKMDDA
jgi:hypothetical protein